MYGVRNPPTSFSFPGAVLIESTLFPIWFLRSAITVSETLPRYVPTTKELSGACMQHGRQRDCARAAHA